MRRPCSSELSCSQDCVTLYTQGVVHTYIMLADGTFINLTGTLTSIV